MNQVHRSLGKASWNVRHREIGFACRYNVLTVVPTLVVAWSWAWLQSSPFTDPDTGCSMVIASYNSGCSLDPARPWPCMDYIIVHICTRCGIRTLVFWSIEKFGQCRPQEVEELKSCQHGRVETVLWAFWCSKIERTKSLIEWARK